MAWKQSWDGQGAKLAGIQVLGHNAGAGGLVCPVCNDNKRQRSCYYGVTTLL